MTFLVDIRPNSPEKAASNVLQAHWDGVLPVNVNEISKRMGVRLQPKGGPFRPYEFSGYYKREAGVPVIEYNVADSQTRQRFTIAHELGHFVLGHADAPRDLPTSFGASVKDPRERAANQFAAELLMPTWAVKKISRSGRFSDVSQLATAFAVSQMAMSYRLVNLGVEI